jgi:hypothetical protein
MRTKYRPVELNAVQKERMFRVAYKTLIACITEPKSSEDFKNRALTYVFAHDMITAEGRKQVSVLTPAHTRWIANNQDRLNRAHKEFKAWVRTMIALKNTEQSVVDRSIEYLDPEPKEPK